VLIDAKNDRAARWTESNSALRMDDAPLSLVLILAPDSCTKTTNEIKGVRGTEILISARCCRRRSWLIRLAGETVFEREKHGYGRRLS